MKKKNPFTRQLQAVIAESDKSRNRISIETGIDSAVLCRFMQGKSGLSMKSLDALAECLQFTITIKTKKKKGSK